MPIEEKNLRLSTKYLIAGNYNCSILKEGITMILDILENAHRYTGLNKGFAKAFEFLSRPDLKELSVGRYEIDGERVYGIVAREPGHRKDDEQLETHEKYIDIQLILAGIDEMGWKPGSLCRLPFGEYNRTSDYQVFADEPDAWVTVKSGSFAIFFPEDAHMAMISSGDIHKLVIKVAV
jgi:YhcH/YjgK/YiaL family protein